jgi:hypothetical protein
MCIASAALPGMMSLYSLARYRVQSSVSTSANLSRPNRTGATAKTIHRRANAWVAASPRSASRLGGCTGLRTA